METPIKRDEVLRLRLTKEEKKKVIRLASSKNMTVSNYVRIKLGLSIALPSLERLTVYDPSR